MNKRRQDVRMEQRSHIKDAIVLALKLEGGILCQGMRWPLEAGTGKETNAVLEPPGET